MESTQKDISPGVLIDQTLRGFFYDRDIDRHIIKLIFNFDKDDLLIEWDDVNHTFKFRILDK